MYVSRQTWTDGRTDERTVVLNSFPRCRGTKSAYLLYAAKHLQQPQVCSCSRQLHDESGLGANSQWLLTKLMDMWVVRVWRNRRRLRCSRSSRTCLRDLATVATADDNAVWRTANTGAQAQHIRRWVLKPYEVDSLPMVTKHFKCNPAVSAKGGLLALS